MISAVVTRKISCSHHLPYYDGKCKDDHGHNYKIEVEFCGEIQVAPGPTMGMLADFTILKKMVDECVMPTLDHKNLNNIISNPTAENMVSWLWIILKSQLHRNQSLPGVELKEIRIWETDDCFVRYTGPNADFTK